MCFQRQRRASNGKDWAHVLVGMAHRHHYLMKRDELLAQCDAWAKESKAGLSVADKKHMAANGLKLGRPGSGLAEQVKQALAKLK